MCTHTHSVNVLSKNVKNVDFFTKNFDFFSQRKNLCILNGLVSSPEPGELIVYPCSGVRRSVRRLSVVRPSVVHNFKDILL